MKKHNPVTHREGKPEATEGCDVMAEQSDNRLNDQKVNCWILGYLMKEKSQNLSENLRGAMEQIYNAQEIALNGDPSLNQPDITQPIKDIAMGQIDSVSYVVHQSAVHDCINRSEQQILTQDLSAIEDAILNDSFGLAYSKSRDIANAGDLMSRYFGARRPPSVEKGD